MLQKGNGLCGPISKTNAACEGPVAFLRRELVNAENGIRLW